MHPQPIVLSVHKARTEGSTRQVEETHRAIEPIKTQKDEQRQRDAPPRPPPEAQDFTHDQQDSEPPEQPHPCRLDRLRTPSARRIHGASRSGNGSEYVRHAPYTGETSCRITVIVLQESTQPFAALHGACWLCVMVA